MLGAPVCCRTQTSFSGMRLLQKHIHFLSTQHQRMAEAHSCVGDCISKLRLSGPPVVLSSAISKYPHIQSLQLCDISLYFSQFEEIGKLPNPRHISMHDLSSPEKSKNWDEPLLQGERGVHARQSAFWFLQTSLELGATEAEYAAAGPCGTWSFSAHEVQHLTLCTKLQHLSLIGCQTTYSILSKLLFLTSLEVEWPQLGISASKPVVLDSRMLFKSASFDCSGSW